MNTTSKRRAGTRLALVSIAWLLLAGGLAAQERVDSKGFDIAVPGWQFQFPRDHGSHDGFRTEWWYFTGHLWTPEGARYGFEVTFFRVGVTPPAGRSPGANPWKLDDLALAHFAVTDLKDRKFSFSEKLSRQSRFTADSREGRLDVFNEGWVARSRGDGTIVLRAQSDEYEIALELEPRKAPAIHGRDGISVKGAGIGYASHYYSMSRLAATGMLRDGNRRVKVTGLAWMDHEFGSAILREDQQGWDWFSIQLDDDTELMLYQIRRSDDTPDTTSSGSFIAQDGSVIHLSHDDFTITPTDRWRSPRSGGVYPMGWTIAVPTLGINLEIEETMRPQELVTEGSTGVVYWEGAVDAAGRSGANAVRGYGYVEMTGYAGDITNLK